MDINFIKQGDTYEAEFALQENAALHLETEGGKSVRLHQRSTSEGKYVQVGSIVCDSQGTIDIDITAAVFPKYIKLVSDVPVLSASYN